MGKRKQTTEQHQNQVISRLTNENDKLRNIVKKKDLEINELKEKLEKALLHIEELQKYVFRGKKKNDDDDKNSSSGLDSNSKSNSSKSRNNSSYRRSIPDERDINNFRTHHIDNCPDCGNLLSKLRVLEFFEEDIISIANWFNSLKKITKIHVTSGYCPHCNKRVFAIPPPKQKVGIGDNVKELVVFHITVLQLSHSQVIDFLKSHLNFEISKGQIVNILYEQALKLKPAHDDLIKSIRSDPGVHIDETSNNIAFHDKHSGNYAWSMSSIKKDNYNTVFVLGKNRGKGNAIKLLGKDYQGIGVSDDYGAYTNIFKNGNHALCWAHPHRKFRDLKNSKYLENEKKIECEIFYKEFAKIYEKVRIINQSDFELEGRKKQKAIIQSELETILKPNKNDPAKLQTLKNTMRKKIERYFVCIIKPNVPTDNNKAERSLRHLVIKRKKSFGQKTPKGAEMMSIIYSVVMSLWWRSKKDFFKAYNEALS